jgi:hypothetical protein
MICTICKEEILDNESFESTSDGDVAHTDCLMIALEWNDNQDYSDVVDNDEE